MSKKFLVITSFLSLVGLIFQFFLTGSLGFVRGIVDILFLGIVFTVVGGFFRKRETSFRFALVRNSLIFGALSGFFSLIFLTFSFWNNTFPGSVSKVTLSDGKRSIVFFQMSHIATPRFYEQVRTDLGQLSMSGYIFYVEGVRSGSLENQKKFEQMLGMKFESDTYIDLADSLGMTAQDESLFDGIGKKQLKNVDISIDDIVTLSLSGGSMLSGEAIPVDMSAELAKIPLRGEGTLFAYMMRSLMNLTLKYTSSLDISSLGMDPRLFDTIVEKRNKYVVDSYIASGHQKVVFLYGALHFQGMYDLLRRSNPDWNILTLEPLYPYVP